MSKSNSENPELRVKEIILRDLESLLRNSFDDYLIVDDYTTVSLLPPGENYGSTILSVHAIIRRKKDAEAEDLYLIAKMSPPTEFQKKVFDSPYSSRKEIFMYDGILPMYNDLEREHGIKDVFKILPKFYGARFSLDPNVDFDDDAVILLENLKAQGYYTGDRAIGYDYEHSKLAIVAMARFHALGIATKIQKPERFEELKKRSRSIKYESNDDFDSVHVNIMKKIESNEKLNKYFDRCKKILVDKPMEEFWFTVPDEPWSTIIHADFWVNNILFHKDEEGRVDDIKFVDFQNYLFLSPVRELIFYLFSSTTAEVRDNRLNELIDLYYDTLIDILKRLDCDVEPYNRESFDAQISKDANIEFAHLCFMLKVLTLDTKETKFEHSDVLDVMVNYHGNCAFDDRLANLVTVFAEKNWI